MLVAFFGGVLGLASCKDDPAVYDKPEVTVAPTPENNTFIFDQSTGTRTLTLKTNRKWTITTSGEDWFAVTPTAGDEGEHTISITVLENGGDARE